MVDVVKITFKNNLFNPFAIFMFLERELFGVLSNEIRNLIYFKIDKSSDLCDAHMVFKDMQDSETCQSRILDWV